VDVFEGALAGLVLSEREFDSDAALRAAAAPAFAAREVTGDAAFSGGALANAEPRSVLAHAEALLARHAGG
jgi:CYTH domain-containing protein